MSQDKVFLYLVGDVAPRRENPESIFALAAPTLKEADILFGQNENTLSFRGVHRERVVTRVPAHPKNVSALTYLGFDVMSAASNHSLDWGQDAFLDTIDLLRKNGIAVIGVGRNIEEARRPAIVERKGTRVGFLAYCSVLPRGYEATSGRPGCAPLRARTAYEQVDWQAGTLPRVLSFANKEDLEAMLDDVAKVRPLVDVVVMSFHWGVQFTPSVIAMYQREVAHAAIDAGVDLIVGHHDHFLKGIEVYKGKVIFYSLGNFAFDFGPAERVRQTSAWKNYQWELDPDYPFYLFPPDSRKSVIVRCTISGKTIEKVSCLPVMLNKQSQPEVLFGSDKRSNVVYDYIEWLCKDQKLSTKFSREGDEVVVNPRLCMCRGGA